MDLCVALKRLVEAEGENQTDVAQTPAFRAWFGSSKVVDAQGKPLVVYHGGPDGITKFSASKSGTFGAGVYLTNAEDTAKGYADNAGPKYNSGKVHAVFAKIDRPYVVDYSLPMDELLKAKSVFKQRGSSERLSSDGYDGVVVIDGDYREYVVFSPNQIKSVDNKGTFSKSSNDIYESLDVALKRLVESDGTIRLYRGLTKAFDAKHDLSQTDAPNGYSTWTDNPKLARAYAGDAGHVYYIDLPIDQQGDELINADGERVLFVDNEKKAGLHGIGGREYLVYTHHDLYDPASIGELT